jgi:NADH:ubiquinone oxidoreductase subunit D
MSVRRLAEPHLQPKGHMIAHVSAVFGSLDIVFGELDR